MILPVKFVLTSPIAALGEHLATLKISPWGWDKALQSLILNGALLDHPALEIWTSTEMRSQLFCQISQRTWIATYAIFMLLYQVRACYGKVEVLWPSKKTARMYPNALNKYEMTKWVYTHIADRLREKHFSVMILQHFWSSTSYLKDELATSFNCSLSLSGFANMMFSRWIQALSVWALCGSDGIQL